MKHVILVLLLLVTALTGGFRTTADDGVVGKSGLGDVLPTALRPAAPPVAETDAEEEVRIHAANPAQESLAQWALSRFAEVGLEVTIREIHLHDDESACGEHAGTFAPGALRVDVCHVGERAKKVLLHELAHAWAYEHLSEADQARYVAIGGFESWNDPETIWARRASEDAAETIAWGLAERLLQMPSTPGPLTEINDRYRLLTGTDAPRVVFSDPVVE